jgi:membrane-bound metal-dependent hydrolase YbcI (DUF457 family)
MDPLTHTAVGFTIAQLGAKRWTKNWGWLALGASNAPDIDGAFFLPGNVNVLDWHRHFTHSLAGAPLMAVITMLIARFVLRREIDWKGGFWLSLLCVVAHDLVDLLTYRGTRLFLPLDDAHHHLSFMPFFDPVLYLILGLGFAAPFLSNLVSGEIGARRSTGMLSAWLAMIAAWGWLGMRYMLKEQAVAELNSRIYEGASAYRVDAYPLYHPLRFVGLVEGAGFKKVFDLNLIEYFDSEGGEIYRDQQLSVEAGLALRAAGATHTAQTFLAWVRWPRVVVTRYDGETRWVVVMQELAREPYKSRARVIIKLDEKYAIQSEVYERSKGPAGI